MNFLIVRATASTLIGIVYAPFNSWRFRKSEKVPKLFGSKDTLKDDVDIGLTVDAAGLVWK